jgi:hypothetical protein
VNLLLKNMISEYERSSFKFEDDEEERFEARDKNSIYLTAKHTHSTLNHATLNARLLALQAMFTYSEK